MPQKELIGCPGCGILNEASQSSCIRCGTNLDAGEKANWVQLPDEVTPEDKKTLLIFLHTKLKESNLVSRAVYKRALLDSIDFLDEMPDEAKRYSINAYIKFLKEAKEKRQIQNLGGGP